MAGKTFEVEIGGKVYEIEAPDQGSALKAIQGFSGGSPASAPPVEAPIAQGDWKALAGRVNAAATHVADGIQGPVTFDQMAENRKREAIRQGLMYGKAQEPGQTAFREFGNTLFLGGPRLSEAYLPAWAGGQSEMPGADAHEFIKAADEGRSQANPKAAIAGKLAGIAPQALVPVGGVTAGGRAAGNAALSAVLGGTEKLVDSRGDTGEGAKGAAIGGLLGLGGSLIGETVGKGVSAVASKFNAKPKIPTLDEVKLARDAAYDTAKNAGVIYDNAALKSAASNVERQFADRGADPILQPGAFVAYNRLLKDAASGQPITGQGLETIRKVAGDAFTPGNASNNALAKSVASEVDNLVANQGAALGGNAKVAAEAIEEARRLHGVTKKTEMVDTLLEKAGLRAGSTHSGGNIQNTSRQELRKMLTDPKLSRGLTQDENAALREAVLGTTAQNAMRTIGNLFPSSGLGGLVAGGGSMAALGPAGLAIPAAGYAVKKGAEMMTDAKVSALRDLILSGGSKAAITPAPNAAQRLFDSDKVPLIAALLGLNSPALAGSGQ